MIKASSLFFIAVFLFFSTVSPSVARGYSHHYSRYYGHHYHHGHDHGADVVGGLIVGAVLGGLLVSALSPPPPQPVYVMPYQPYAAPPPVTVYQPPVCYQERKVSGEWQRSSYGGTVWVTFAYPMVRRVQVPCY